MRSPADAVNDIYGRLFAASGPQGWWPADSPAEMIVGAILIQHAGWTQVERAIEALRDNDLLDFRALDRIEPQELAAIIRPAGTPRIKARRLQAFARFVGHACEYQLDELWKRPTAQLRRDLLAVHGIGPETADCILLYAGGRALFVADAYAKRVLERHGLIPRDASYEFIRQFAETAAAPNVGRLQEFHALLVAVGKAHCRRSAQCRGCPLEHLEDWPPRV